MQDANELAHAVIDVVKGANTLTEALKQYEEKMFQRVEVFGKVSAANLILFFEEDAPKGWIEKLKSRFAQAGLKYNSSEPQS
jgi:2-polyprenyl-6-methoxyphenol hydroxylase-like FAD-dependent oxidoreductase